MKIFLLLFEGYLTLSRLLHIICSFKDSILLLLFLARLVVRNLLALTEFWELGHEFFDATRNEVDVVKALVVEEFGYGTSSSLVVVVDDDLFGLSVFLGGGVRMEVWRGVGVRI